MERQAEACSLPRLHTHPGEGICSENNRNPLTDWMQRCGRSSLEFLKSTACQVWREVERQEVPRIIRIRMDEGLGAVRMERTAHACEDIYTLSRAWWQQEYELGTLVTLLCSELPLDDRS